jgi:hypothetical protein
MEMFSADRVASGRIKELLIERVSAGFVLALRSSVLPQLASAPIRPTMWRTAGSWDASGNPPRGFHWGPIPAVGSLAIPHGHMNDVPLTIPVR